MIIMGNSLMRQMSETNEQNKAWSLIPSNTSMTDATVHSQKLY